MIQYVQFQQSTEYICMWCRPHVWTFLRIPSQHQELNRTPQATEVSWTTFLHNTIHERIPPFCYITDHEFPRLEAETIVITSHRVIIMNKWVLLLYNVYPGQSTSSSNIRNYWLIVCWMAGKLRNKKSTQPSTIVRSALNPKQLTDPFHLYKNIFLLEMNFGHLFRAITSITSDFLAFLILKIAQPK